MAIAGAFRVYHNVGLRSLHVFRGSITRPMISLCTLRSRGRPRATQHSLPTGVVSPWSGGTCTRWARMLGFMDSLLIPFPRARAFLAHDRCHGDPGRVGAVERLSPQDALGTATRTTLCGRSAWKLRATSALGPPLGRFADNVQTVNLRAPRVFGLGRARALRGEAQRESDAAGTSGPPKIGRQRSRSACHRTCMPPTWPVVMT